MSKTKQDAATATTFPKKYAKLLQTMPEFKDLSESSSAEELKKMIVLAEGNVYTIEQAKENDVKLNAAKEVLADSNAPYREALACQRCKIAYALFLLDGKGETIGDQEE